MKKEFGTYNREQHLELAEKNVQRCIELGLQCLDSAHRSPS